MALDSIQLWARKKTMFKKCNIKKLRQAHKKQSNFTSLLFYVYAFFFVSAQNILNAYFMGASHSWKPQIFAVVAVLFSSFPLHVSIRFALKTYYTLHFSLLLYSYNALSGKKMFLVTSKPPANHFSLWNFRFTSFYTYHWNFIGLSLFSSNNHLRFLLRLRSLYLFFRFQCYNQGKKIFKGCFLP